jgi:DNA polymerase-3 subunit chi
MTQIDFYILQPEARGDRYRLVCLITEKAYQAGHRVLIHAPEAEDARHIDRLLWTYNQQNFIPHGLLNQADPYGTPVLIGNAEQNDEEHDVLINLSLHTPDNFSRFQRLAECVDNDEQARQASRERYKFYREHGYPLKLHHIH